MNTTYTAHSTFVIERTLPASRARVFSAWAEAEKKRRWFACHDDWRQVQYTLDFRLNGVEVNTVERPDGVKHFFEGRYLNIVLNDRIVYAYTLYVGPVLISVSLVTVEFTPAPTAADKTLMTFTEQVAFLDSNANVEERREGTAIGLDRIADILALD